MGSIIDGNGDEPRRCEISIDGAGGLGARRLGGDHQQQ
jgi:hypothetical protein